MGHTIHIPGVIDHKLCQIAMSFLDATLGKIAGFAEILVTSTTGAAPGVGTGAADLLPLFAFNQVPSLSEKRT
jgi:hypothetical protein